MVEHVFSIVEDGFGCRKAVYPGAANNCPA